MPLNFKHGATITVGICLKHLYYQNNRYTGKINKRHSFIKRKQVEYFGGMLISAYIFGGMAYIPDFVFGYS